VVDCFEDQGPLDGLRDRVQDCQRCELGKTRTNVVFGAGSSSADLMFVGEAPGYHEDQQGIPFVGKAGQLLDQLLDSIGLARDAVYIANVLKCRPPDNRDPLIEEIQLCRDFLEEQINIIEPRVICTLGNFATKLLSGRADGISRVHGRAQTMPGRSAIQLFPVFHPAAALYTPANLNSLKADFQVLRTLLSGPGAQVQVEAAAVEPQVAVKSSEGEPEPEQLGLF